MGNIGENISVQAHRAPNFRKEVVKGGGGYTGYALPLFNQISEYALAIVALVILIYSQLVKNFCMVSGVWAINLNDLSSKPSSIVTFQWSLIPYYRGTDVCDGVPHLPPQNTRPATTTTTATAFAR